METILVLDLGSQHSQVIARKVRQCKVYCEIVTGEQVISEIQRLQPKGLILSHGHGGGQLDEPEVPVELFELGIPVLGIGFGFQLMTSLAWGGMRHNQFGSDRRRTAACGSGFFVRKV